MAGQLKRRFTVLAIVATNKCQKLELRKGRNKKCSYESWPAPETFGTWEMYYKCIYKRKSSFFKKKKFNLLIDLQFLKGSKSVVYYTLMDLSMVNEGLF